MSLQYDQRKFEMSMKTSKYWKLNFTLIAQK